MNNFLKDDFPLVSIITPSYNQGCFIRETIESVLNQDYPNIEYIVVDGASADETCEILEEYSGKIKWISEQDRGQADAVNKGIAMSHGEIIGWLNSDDIYLKGAVSKLIGFWKEHAEADMVYGNGLYINKKGEKTGIYPTEEFSQRLMMRQCIICQPTAFFSRDVLEKVGMLDINYQLGMDYELWMRIAKQGIILHADIWVAASRLYEETKTLSRKEEAYIEACDAVKKNYGYVPAEWTRGFAFYLCGMKRNLNFFLKAMYFAILFNLPALRPVSFWKKRKKQ